MSTLAPPIHRARNIALRLVGTAVALSWVFTQVRPQDALGAFADMPLWLLCVPFLGMVTTTILQGARLSLMMGAAHAPVSFLGCVGVVCRASFAGLLLPSGGQEVAKLALLARGTGQMPAAVTTVLGVRLLQLPTWILLLGWGIGSGFLDADPVLRTTAMVFIAAAFGVLGLTVLSARGMGSGLLDRLPRAVAERVHRFGSVWGQVGRERRTLAGVLLLGIPLVVVHSMVVAAVMRGFGTPLALPEVFAILPSMDLLVWLPVSIGGIGMRESVFIHALSLRGIPTTTALAIGMVRWTGELARAVIGCMLLLHSGLAGPMNEKSESQQ